MTPEGSSTSLWRRRAHSALFPEDLPKQRSRDEVHPRDADVTLDLPYGTDTLTTRARVAFVEEPLAESGPNRIGLEFIALPPEGSRLTSTLVGGEPGRPQR